MDQSGINIGYSGASATDFHRLPFRGIRNDLALCANGNITVRLRQKPCSLYRKTGFCKSPVETAKRIPFLRNTTIPASWIRTGFITSSRCGLFMARIIGFASIKHPSEGIFCTQEHRASLDTNRQTNHGRSWNSASPEVQASTHGGRMRAPSRACLEGILWLL